MAHAKEAEKRDLWSIRRQREHQAQPRDEGGTWIRPRPRQAERARESERVADRERQVVARETVGIENRGLQADDRGDEERFEAARDSQEPSEENSVHGLQSRRGEHLQRRHSRPALGQDDDIFEPASLVPGPVRGKGLHPRVGERVIGQDGQREKIAVDGELDRHQGHPDAPVPPPGRPPPPLQAVGGPLEPRSHGIRADHCMPSNEGHPANAILSHHPPIRGPAMQPVLKGATDACGAA